MRGGLLALFLFGGCVQTFPEGSGSCVAARRVFARCGISAPLLDNKTCEGPERLVAECVLDHATSCDDLAQTHWDDCVRDIESGDLTGKDGGL